MPYRSFRGSRRRSSMRPVIQSYKKVLNFAQASFTAGFQNELLVNGADSTAAGQTSATDATVPTGALVKFVEFQLAINNSVASPLYINVSLQYKNAGQTFQDPNAIGGNAQRNQVLHQELFSVGQDQNSTHKFKWKIPGKFQRIREARQWSVTWSCSASCNREAQCIYKFYR